MVETVAFYHIINLIHLIFIILKIML